MGPPKTPAEILKALQKPWVPAFTKHRHYCASEAEYDAEVARRADAVEILKRRYIGQDAKRRRLLHWECLGFWGKVGHLLTAPFCWLARRLREYVQPEQRA